MKVAIYNRGKKLAVREQPEAGASMVDTLESGTAVAVEEAGTGWLKCCTGYIRADLVAVGELRGVLTGQLQEAPTEDEEKPEVAPTEEAQPQEGQAEEATAEEAPTEDENAALKAMKLNDLRELAKGSGIALPKNATKAQIIELLTGSDEQA